MRNVEKSPAQIREEAVNNMVRVLAQMLAFLKSIGFPPGTWHACESDRLEQMAKEALTPFALFTEEDQESMQSIALYRE